MGLIVSIFDFYVRLNGALLCFYSFQLLPGCRNPAPTPNPMVAGSATQTPTTLRPTLPHPTAVPTIVPTLVPSVRPTTDCHLVDNPPRLSALPGTNLVRTVVNRPAPPGCVLQTTCGVVANTENFFATLAAFFRIIGDSSLIRVRVTTEDGERGLNVGVVSAPGLNEDNGFCRNFVINPRVPAEAEVVVSGPTADRQVYLVVGSSAASGPLPTGSLIRLQMMRELCGAPVIQSLDASASVGSSVTFPTNAQQVPSSCPIRQCAIFADGNVNLVVRIIGRGNALQPLLSGGIPVDVAFVSSLTDPSAGACLRELPNVNPFVGGLAVNANDGFLILSTTSGIAVGNGTPVEIRLVSP